MKIEKKKVIGNSRLSKATKAGVASLLGMSAILMSGCLDDAESSPVAGPINASAAKPSKRFLLHLYNRRAVLQKISPVLLQKLPLAPQKKPSAVHPKVPAVHL